MSEPVADEATIWQYLGNSLPQLHRSGVVEALKSVARYGGYPCIFPVTGLCLDQFPDVREAAWKAVDRLLNDLPVEKLPHTDVLMRQYGIIVKPIKLIHELSVPTNALGLVSFNSDGHVRETALKELARRFTGEELPFILLRINDWVTPIHRLAVESVRDRLPRGYGRHFAKNVSLLRYLWASQRFEHEPLRSLIEGMLASAENHEFLVQQLSSPDRLVRRYVFELCVSPKHETFAHTREAITQGLKSPDGAIQLNAAEAAFKHLPRSEITTMIPVLLKSSYAPVRKESLRWMADTEWEDWRVEMTNSLFDKNRAVREFARYRLPDVDAAALYIQRLQAGTEKAEPALRGLQETNTLVSQDLIAPFLSHSSGRVRAAAYDVLFRICEQNAPDLIVRALTDKSGRCAREAHKFLARHSNLLSGDSLWNLLATAASPRAKKSIVHALSRLSKWESLPYLLQAKALPDVELQNAVAMSLDFWLGGFNRSFTSPDKHQLKRCHDAFLLHGKLLPAKQRAKLEFLLKEHCLTRS